MFSSLRSRLIQRLVPILLIIVVMAGAWTLMGWIDDLETEQLIFSLTASLLVWLLWSRYDDRRRERQRQRLFQEMREMLRDRVLNQLSIISVNAQLSEMDPQRRLRLDEAVRNITDIVEKVSTVEFDAWREVYAETLDKEIALAADSPATQTTGESADGHPLESDDVPEQRFNLLQVLQWVG